ncbi:hypothetical protein J2T17_004458 [Paenibacillus mucilaginosus]|uniref:hypothetical protein n=1 Tax=Paenibacillus mucilaginosus TaxID=61624 RepID=UPI003D1C1199
MENNHTNQEGLFSDNAYIPASESAGTGLDMTLGEDGQLSLFGPAPEAANEEKKEKGVRGAKASAKGKSAAPKSSAAPAAPKLDKVPLEEPSWTVRLYGVSYIVNNLFEEEMEAGKTEATLEEIREKLMIGEGHVELTHGRVHWTVQEETKYLFIDCYGTTKGAV